MKIDEFVAEQPLFRSPLIVIPCDQLLRGLVDTEGLQGGDVNDWECRCGEINPPDFGTCWFCGAFEEDPDLFDVVPGRAVQVVAVKEDIL